MADQLLSEKKGVIESVIEVFERGAEVVASLGVDIIPGISIISKIVKLALNNVESKEAVFMKEQFQKVRDRLEVVSEELKRINNEIKKSGMDVKYFQVEENIRNQFGKYTDILNATKANYQEVRKNEFLEHFSLTGGDINLHTLYDAVTGDNFSGESVLEIILKYEEKSRRPVEEFCAMLKKLFCIGLLALLGRAALVGKGEEEALLKEWGEKMKVVQEKMNAVIEDCIVSFPKQAEEDSRKIVRDNSGCTNQELADALLEKLKNKYDWVSWSVHVFRTQQRFLDFFNKKDYHYSKGKSCFQVPSSDEKLNIWISYSSSPQPLDKEQIQQLIQSQKKLSAVSLAEFLFEKLPGDCVVHTVETSEDPACSWTFSEELHYWEEHKNIYVCVHSA